MISRRLLLSCILFAAGALASRHGLAQSAWTSWAGSKFGTRIDYPSDLFAIMPEPDAHDGRSFAAADGAQIAAWGAFADVVDFESAIATTRDAADYSEATYRRREKNWAVVSGYRSIEGQRSVFYERYFLDPGKAVYHVVAITYPVEARATYDPIVGRIAGSLDNSRYEAPGQR